MAASLLIFLWEIPSPVAAETGDIFPLPASLEALSHPCWESTSLLLGGELERGVFGGYYQYSCTAAIHSLYSLLKHTVSFSRAWPAESGTLLAAARPDQSWLCSLVHPMSFSQREQSDSSPVSLSPLLLPVRWGSISWIIILWHRLRASGIVEVQALLFHWAYNRQNMSLSQVSAVPEPKRHSKLCVNFQISSPQFIPG